MKQGDNLSFRLNLLMLLFVSLLPFTTKVMVTHMTGVDARFAVAVYGLNVLVAASLLTGLMVYARDFHLLVDDVADHQLQRTARQRWWALGVNVLAILVALIAPLAAVGIFVILAVMFIIQPLFGTRRKSQGSK